MWQQFVEAELRWMEWKPIVGTFQGKGWFYSVNFLCCSVVSFVASQTESRCSFSSPVLLSARFLCFLCVCMDSFRSTSFLPRFQRHAREANWQLLWMNDNSYAHWMKIWVVYFFFSICNFLLFQLCASSFLGNYMLQTRPLNKYWILIKLRIQST